MPKNDYFEIAYKILSYLYDSFQAGTSADITFYGADALGINKGYWVNIMESLYDEGYIKGIELIRGAGGRVGIANIDLKITKDGIIFLQENSLIGKARRTLKAAKETIPGI